MGRHSKIQLTEELEKEVVEFYLAPNSAREVERVFGLNLYQLNKILTKHGIAVHNNKVVQDIKRQQLAKTLLERYGVTSTFKAEEILQKCKQTNLARYGFDYAMKSPELQQKSRETCIKNHSRRLDVGRFGSIEHKKWMADKKYLEKSRQTCLEKYGVASVMQNTEIKNKSFARRKALHSLNTSKPEKLLYENLVSKYGNIEEQYTDDRYPFYCDFYIPIKDLFIELNLNWTHGRHPFNENNLEDLALLERWKEKAKTSKYYQNAIETWTVRDTKKQKIAKENNLNYRAIYIDEWNQIKKELQADV